MTAPAAAQSKEIDCLSPEAQRLAEARLAAKRAARAEAREIRMKELERQQREVEERPEKDFAEKGPRNLPGLSAATLASLGGTSSRRGSGDTSVSVDTEASIREIKDSLAEAEEKYKKAMVSNAQLDNEKMNYMYQVDTLKDALLELEEQLAEARRQCEEKSKEFEREKHAHSLLQFQFAEVKAALQQREEMLQKHGIILNSETATNGETSDTLNNVGCQGSTKMTKEELNTLKATGDGALGKATAVKVKNEIVENVGKREILQNTEEKQHREGPVEKCVDAEALHPADSAEDPKPSEDRAPSPGTLAASEAQVQSPVLESMSYLEHTEQMGSGEVTGAPDARTGAPLEPSECPCEPGGGILGPVTGQGSQNAVDIDSQCDEAVEKQEPGEQDSKTNSGGVSTKPHQESAPVQTAGVEEVGSSQGTAEAGLTGLGQHVGAAASGPPRCSNDAGSHGDRGAIDVPKELDPSAGCGLEKELTDQDVAEPGEVPLVQGTGVGGEVSDQEDEGRGCGNENLAQMEDLPSPTHPAASAQEAAGAGRAGAKSGPLGGKEPSGEKSSQPAEGLDSSPKKTKNKKRKNKRKKSPGETPKGVREELAPQSPGLSGVTEEEQVEPAEENPGAGAHREATGTPEQDAAAGGSGHPGWPGGPEVGLDGKLSQEDGHVNAGAGGAEGGPVPLDGAATQASGSSARGSEEGALEADAEGAAAPSRPPEKEGALLGNASPSEDTNATRQGGREGLESISLEDDDLAPAGEVEDVHPESREEAKGRSGDKSKEDCSLS